jgi:hypothetical protein
MTTLDPFPQKRGSIFAEHKIKGLGLLFYVGRSINDQVTPILCEHATRKLCIDLLLFLNSQFLTSFGYMSNFYCLTAQRTVM